jgi:cobalamin-dependent methionine synthase I
MIDSVIFLEKIIFDPPLDKIYSRLGFRKKTTSLSPAQKQETNRLIEEAASCMRLQGCFLRLRILQNDGRNVRLACGPSFASEKLSTFLKDSREAVLMGATAGSGVLGAISEKTKKGDMTAAVVYDATASEMTDATLDWMTGYINRQLRREGTTMLKRRFSAGYADFALENQKDIYEALQLEKIGVSITSGFILQPEKSVTAISGIA